MKKAMLNRFAFELERLESGGNLRTLPMVFPDGKEIEVNGHRMLNLSSNDYLGVALDDELRKEFLENLNLESFVPSSSSSRLLTGNFVIYEEVEELLARMFETESALVFGSGYHMNIGILPAICTPSTLILADKLVHASLIDGIRLSTSKFIRYPHHDYNRLHFLLEEHAGNYESVLIVTESIFSMDGDETDLNRLASLKKQYGNVMLYVDEAHAVGVRGARGLGCAEEQNCIPEIDFLVGTFGKALASVGAYLVCRKVVRDYLVNKMRPLIYTTALPPINLEWTKFVLQRLFAFESRRNQLRETAGMLCSALKSQGHAFSSCSHIVPMIIGDSLDTVRCAEELQRKGFYALAVRPPTVPEGSSRIRFSLTSALACEDVQLLIDQIKRKE